MNFHVLQTTEQNNINLRNVLKLLHLNFNELFTA
jgi:hypothetical protein